MTVTKIFFIVSLLYAQEITAVDPAYKLANSLNKARNVSVDFPSNSDYPSIPTNPPSSPISYWSTKFTKNTAQPTARPAYSTRQYTPSMTTNYMPPCWTQTTPQVTHTLSTPRYTPTTATAPTTKYLPPCWNQTPPRVTTPPSRTTVFPEPADSTAQCPQQDGYFPVPNSDCSQYIVCEDGIATLMNCPTGLVFNEKRSICDWPIHVPSCYPDALKDITCPELDDTEAEVINMFRYQNSCHYYVACQSGFPRLLSCPDDLHFDLDKQTCVDESYVTDCDE